MLAAPIGVIIAAVTPYRWAIAGCGFLAATAVLAVLAVVQVLDAASGVYVPPVAGPDTPVGPAYQNVVVQFLRGVIYGVLAGVAFFSGIACFFWGALLDSRQQTAQLLALLRPRGSADASRQGQD